MKKSRTVSLQTKIVSLIIALILFVVLLLAGIFVYIQSVDTEAPSRTVSTANG